MRKTLVLLLTSFAFCAQTVDAQQAPAEDSSEPWYRNLSIGVRVGARFLDPLGSLEATEQQPASDPPQTTTISSGSATKRYLVGPTVHLQVSDRWGITVDALFSRAGYDASSKTETQVAEGETAELISTLHERTRVDYWDIPILGRYYLTGFQEDPARLYLTGGVTVRTVSGVSSHSELVLDDDLSKTSAMPAQASNKTVPGAAVGGGLRLHDEVGLKIDLEVRFTRWFSRTFDSSVAHSSLNEGAAFISFSF